MAAFGLAERPEGEVVGFVTPPGDRGRSPSPGPGDGPPAAAAPPAAADLGVAGPAAAGLRDGPPAPSWPPAASGLVAGGQAAAGGQEEPRSPDRSPPRWRDPGTPLGGERPARAGRSSDGHPDTEPALPAPEVPPLPPGAAEAVGPGPVPAGESRAPVWPDAAPSAGEPLPGAAEEQPRPPVLEVPPPPPAWAPASSPADVPELCCPLCPAWSTRGRPRALLLHLQRTHEGEPLGPHGAAVLRGLRRGVCPRCSGLRAESGRTCHHCGETRPPLRARATDVVVVPQAPARRPPPAQEESRERFLLPPDWEAPVSSPAPLRPTCRQQRGMASPSPQPRPSKHFWQGRRTATWNWAVPSCSLRRRPLACSSGQRCPSVSGSGGSGNGKPCSFGLKPRPGSALGDGPAPRRRRRSEAGERASSRGTAPTERAWRRSRAAWRR